MSKLRLESERNSNSRTYGGLAKGMPANLLVRPSDVPVNVASSRAIVGSACTHGLTATPMKRRENNAVRENIE